MSTCVGDSCNTGFGGLVVLLGMKCDKRFSARHVGDGSLGVGYLWFAHINNLMCFTNIIEIAG